MWTRDKENPTFFFCRKWIIYLFYIRYKTWSFLIKKKLWVWRDPHVSYMGYFTHMFIFDFFFLFHLLKRPTFSYMSEIYPCLFFWWLLTPIFYDFFICLSCVVLIYWFVVFFYIFLFTYYLLIYLVSWKNCRKIEKKKQKLLFQVIFWYELFNIFVSVLINLIVTMFNLNSWN